MDCLVCSKQSDAATVAGLKGGSLVSANQWIMSSGAFSMTGCTSPGYLIDVSKAATLAHLQLGSDLL